MRIKLKMLVVSVFVLSNVSLLAEIEGKNEEIEFDFSIGRDFSCNQNCLELSVNGGAFQSVGCNKPRPMCNYQGPVTEKRLKLKASRYSYNHFRLRLTRFEKNGTKQEVFASNDESLPNKIAYFVNARTEQSVDLWINDNDDSDYRDFRLKIKAPAGVAFGLNYLQGAACPLGPNGKNGQGYTYRSVIRRDLPIGLNGVTMKLKSADPSYLPEIKANPVGTLDIYVPELDRVLNHRDIYLADLMGGDAATFVMHYFSVPEYRGIQFRICSYLEKPVELTSISTQFDSSKPFTYGNHGLAGVRPLDPKPDLSGLGVISVDFSRRSTRKKSLSGMMIGVRNPPQVKFPVGATVPSPEKVADMIRPLKQGIWRAFPSLRSDDGPASNMEYAKASGIDIVASLMSLGKQFQQELGKPPHADVNEWTNWVANLIHQHGPTIRYIDVWNEPEVNKFWPKENTPAQLFEIYRGAVEGLKKSGETRIKIGGLSLNNYNAAYMTAFLEYALKHQLEVNVLSWHELKSAEADLSVIEAHIKDAKRRFMDPSNPKYRALNIQEIHINEALSQQNVTFPGDRLASLHYLEKGGADRAAEDCWLDQNGKRMARDGSICGYFIRPESGVPESAWYKPRNTYWLQKNYADLLEQRIPCSSSNKNIVCFAGSADPNTGAMQVVVGYHGMVHTFKDAKLYFSLSGLAAELAPHRRMHVKLERIPTQNNVPIPKLPIIREYDAKIPTSHLTVNLPDLKIHEAAVLTLTPL